MFRNTLIALCVMALAVPAFGYEVIWDGNPDGCIQIELQIDCYIQIEWQDIVIVFNDGAGDPLTWDFWAEQLENVGYARCPDNDGKHPPNPWAGSGYYAPNGLYYESCDGGDIFIRSNNDFHMDVHVNGNLTGTLNAPYGEIPTWFTLCLCPFMMDGTWLDDGYLGGIPFSGGQKGCYVFGGDTGGAMTYCDATYPNQKAFPCAISSTTWTLGIDAPAEGTMKFLCRILRHGMMDPGDLYRTVIDVHFATP